MNALSKNRILFWILIFLVLVNISVLAGYFVVFRNSANKAIPETTAKPGWALQKELSLTPDQIDKVQAINHEYKTSSEPIILNIQKTKAKLLDELAKENTDTLLMTKLAEDVNLEQKKLQMANIHQFLDLKKVCSPEQTKKLSQIYSDLYGCSNIGKGYGHGNGNGMGHRHRWGQQKMADSTQKQN